MEVVWVLVCCCCCEIGVCVAVVLVAIDEFVVEEGGG